MRSGERFGPITGPYRELAERVRGLMGDSSYRMLSRKTNVNFNTLGLIARGGRASEENLVRLAKAFSLNPNELLVLGGYARREEFDILWERGGQGGREYVLPRSGMRLVGEPGADDLPDDILNTIDAVLYAERLRKELE